MMQPERPPAAPVRRRPSGLTLALAVVAVAAVAAAITGLLDRSTPTSPSGPGAKPSTAPPPVRVTPAADSPCTWLDPAAYAAVGVTTSALVDVHPPTGLQPLEIYCSGSAGVFVDYRWQPTAKPSAAAADAAGWVAQLRESKWTVTQVTVPGAGAAYIVSTGLDAASHPTPEAQLLMQTGALRVLLAIPTGTANPQAALTTLAAHVAQEIPTLGHGLTTKAPTPPPPSPSG